VQCDGVELRVSIDEPLGSGVGGVRVEGEWRRWGGTGAALPERTGSLRIRRIEPGAEDVPPISLRARLQLAAQQRVRALYGADAPLVEALLLARTETLPRAVRTRFAEAGLVHLLAISGTHVALVLGVLLVLARAARLHAATARACALTGVIAYVLFLGAPAPAARAALQITLLSLGRALQRPSDRLSALAVAGLLLVTADPAVVLDAGAQLSFAGVAGIVAFVPRIEGTLQRMPRALGSALATGIAASATTLPIAGLHFGTLAPIGILAGVPGVPLTALAVPAAALPLVVSLASEQAAAFLVPAARLALAALDRVAVLAAAVPHGHGLATAGDVHALLVAASAALLVRRHMTGMPVGARVAGAGAAVAALFVLALRPAATAFVGGAPLEIHALDVGQGDAVAIRSPRGRWLLIDAGPRSRSYDAGAARVVPYLERRRARALAGLIITHPDADHIGGAAATLAALDVHAVLEPSQPGPRGMYIATLDQARRSRARWIAAREGARIDLDGVAIEVLHPRRRLDAREGANDYSVVVLLRYGAFRALLLGDAPTAAEEWLVARRPGLGVHVIKVGHHGSATSTGDVLLRAAQPAVALVSVGRRNRYGHPHPEVIGRLAAHGIGVLRTDERGAIVVRAGRDGRFTVRTER
jgi:competence protein ComEC